MEAKLIGNKIAEARKRTSISQAQLAELLFITPQAVGKWERGESLPDIITLNRLAKILKVDLNYFSENEMLGNNEMLDSRPDVTEENEEAAFKADDVAQPKDRRVLVNFSGSNLPESDFAGVTVKKGKFEGSSLRGSDFSGTDLTGSSFAGSDLRDANFNQANLTDCNFYALDLSGASFNQTILVRTNFSASGLDGAKFIDVKLTDVKLSVTDLRKTVFENCLFDGTNFDKSDMRGMCFDGQSFVGVTFDNSVLKDASFKGATFKDVSFRATFALTNRFYRALKTICFDGAKMDKLSYLRLKGLGANLTNVTTF
jgi:uncharacterized protein YjbI with pentapeptide repeats